MIVCPHCGNPLIHETTANRAGQTVARDVCPLGTDFFSTAWTTDGAGVVGAFTDSYRGQDFTLAPTLTSAATGSSPVGLLEETWIAAVDLGGHRAVTTDPGGHLVYRQPDTDWYGPCLLTLSAAAAGADVRVAVLGPVDETSWTWTPNLPIYLAANGLLTQVPPAGPGALVVLGVAAAPTRLMFAPHFPIRQVA